MNDQGVDLAGPKEAEPIKKTRVRKSKLVIASPSGEEVSLKHIAKHFRDTLELHHKEAIVVDEKGDRHWTIDLESPLSLWFKEGDTYREDVKAIQPGPESPICQRCDLFTNCKNPFIKPLGAEEPIVSVFYEFTSGSEDEQGKLGVGGISSRLRDVWKNMAQHAKLPFDKIRWVPMTRCANRPRNGIKKVVNYKTKINWCGLYAVQDIMLHTPVVMMPVGSVVLGYFSFKSNAQDWGGKLLTYRGWPDDWLMEPKYSKRVDGRAPGHVIFGQHDAEFKVPMIPVQIPGIIDATQNRKIKELWLKSISGALKLAMVGIPPKNYILPHYKISEKPEEIIRDLKWLIDHPKTLVAFDTETTGLKAYAEGASIVYVMLRWEDGGKPRSIGFPWDYPESPLKPHLSTIAPYLNKALESSVLVGHNLTFDALFAAANFEGADLDKIADACKYDTWHEAFVLRQAKGSLSLDMMAYEHVPELGGYDEDFSILIELERELLHPEQGGHYAKCPEEYKETHLKPYVMGDVEVTYKTHEVLRKKYTECKCYKIPLAHRVHRGKFRWYQTMSRQVVYDKIVSPASGTLIKMMGRGLKVDIKELSFQEEMFPQLIFEARKKLREITPEVLEWCEYMESQQPGWFLDLESKDHLRTILYEKMRMPIKALTSAGIQRIRDKKFIVDRVEDLVGPLERAEKAIRDLSHDDEDFKAKWNDVLKIIAIDKFSLNGLSAENPKVRPLLEYRSIFKQYASYIRTIRNITTKGIDKKARTKGQHLARDGMVHAQFLITGTRSGRLSCVDGSTLLKILKSDGQVELVEIKDVDPTQHVSIMTHLGRWRPITAKFFKGYEDMFSVKSKSGRQIICTNKHRFLTPSGWKYLKDLGVGSELSCDSSFKLDALPMGDGQGGRNQIPGRGHNDSRIDPVRFQPENSAPNMGLLSFRAWGADGTVISESPVNEALWKSKWFPATDDNHPRDGVEVLCRERPEHRHDGQEVWNHMASCAAKPPSVKFDGQSMVIQSTSRPDPRPTREAVCIQSTRGGGLENKRPEQGKVCARDVQMLSVSSHNITLDSRLGQQCVSVIVEERAKKDSINLLVHKPTRDDSGLGSGGQPHSICSSSKYLKQNGSRLCHHRHQRSSRGGWALSCEGGRHEDGQPDEAAWAKGPAFFTPRDEEQHPASHGENIEVDTITEISPVGIRSVWDIQVDEDHSYTAHGFINHNSRDPNLQQLPARGQVKRIYTSRFGDKGCLYQGDLSQIELRLIAAACGDEAMVDAYVRGIDLHSLTMSRIFKMPYEHCIKDHVSALQKAGKDKEAKECELKRKISKTINFLTGYGGGAQGLQATLAQDGIYQTIEECEAFLEAFFDSYPALREYLSYYKGFIESNGVAVSMLGRVRIFEEAGSDDKGLKSKALRAGCNHLIQATASDMMLCCICAIETLMRDAGLKSILISTVHDSLLVDCVREELPIVHEIAMSVFTNIPDILETWIGDDVDLSWTRILPFDGDSEVGKNYLDMVKLSHDNNDWADVFKRMDEE
jgi:DNA polymerase I-like protein with 3'-5' exonuclease and polymerase domains